MELKVADRLVLLNLLPKEGDFTTLKIVRKLREDLSFSEDEHKALEFKQDNGSIQWNPNSDIPKEIPIGEKASDMIADVLKKLDKDKHLQEQHFALYEMFVENVK